MAGISQHIPNYIKGISRQPDELKTPGQVRDAKELYPRCNQWSNEKTWSTST